PESFEDRPHRAAGDDPGARLGCTHDHLPSTVTADDVVMQCTAFTQRHTDHAAPRLLRCFANGFGHLARLSGAVADPPLPVADHNERSEPETPPTLHHLGNPVDVDKLFGELAVFALARLTLAVASSSPLRLCARRRTWHTDPFKRPGRPRGRHRPGP